MAKALTCTVCGREPREDENAADEWRAYLDVEDELRQLDQQPRGVLTLHASQLSKRGGGDERLQQRDRLPLREVARQPAQRCPFYLTGSRSA